MSVFITGASEYIGGSVAARFVADGYAVRGLVRDEAKAARLAALGIEPVLGTLEDSELLSREARASERVINAASSDHRGAIQALLDGLAGSSKPFLHTSGSSVVADDARGAYASEWIVEDDTPFTPEPEKAARAAIDQMVRDAKHTGIRSVVLCNTMIYGTGRGIAPDSVQIPPLVHQARRSGVVRTVGPGLNIWSNVHLDDAVDLYAAAFDRALAGSFYFVENGEASFREIAEAIARRLRLGEPQPWSVEEASAEWGRGHALYSFGSNSRVRGRRARDELAWRPHRESVTAWREHRMPIIGEVTAAR